MGSFLEFEQLPEPVQDIIFSLASTPSCPTQSLLATVSKRWATAALQHSRLHGVTIILDLPNETASPQQQHEPQQQQQDRERLESLARWLVKHGHSVTGLKLRSWYAFAEQEFAPGSGAAASGILEALAAAGAQQQESLRLRQLQLPALGCCSPATIVRALSGCHQLRQLQLDSLCGTESWHPSSYLRGVVPEALQQLKRLTRLTLNLPTPEQEAGTASSGSVSLRYLCGCLSWHLLTLNLSTVGSKKFSAAVQYHLDVCSLRHLVHLQQLMLPYKVEAFSSQEDNPLTRLTALTYLNCGQALQPAAEDLLVAPNLVDLQAGLATLGNLGTLVSKTSLRNLRCSFMLDAAAAGAAAVGQLTQLTGLRVWVEGSGSSQLPDQGVWSNALSALTGLRSLAIEPVLLSPATVRAMTGLTKLDMVAWLGERPHAYDCMEGVLQGLTPEHSQLKYVALDGVLDAEQQRLRSALPAAMSGVSLVFTHFFS